MYISTYPIGIVAGLPSIIPGSLRLLIKAGDREVIRRCLAFLVIYRVLKIPSVLKLGTITDPFKGIYTSIPSLEIGRVFRSFPNPKLELRGTMKLLKITTAGPNGNPSILNVFSDITVWISSPLLPDLLRFVALVDGPDSSFLKLLIAEITYRKTTPVVQVKPLQLGKLSVKEEPAGKARVFAITDLITQSIMKPLHSYIFSILKKLPMDGTFDQGAPLDRLRKLYDEGVIVGHKFHSYDLSAATDRLPIHLQQDILGYYVGTEIAGLWRKLLTDRD